LQQRHYLVNYRLVLIDLADEKHGLIFCSGGSLLATLPWIAAPKGGSHDQMALQLFKQMHRQPDGVIEADSELI